MEPVCDVGIRFRMDMTRVTVVTGVDDINNARCCNLEELLTSTVPVITITVVTGQVVLIATVVYPCC
jgi:hypothetical protein